MHLGVISTERVLCHRRGNGPAREEEKRSKVSFPRRRAGTEARSELRGVETRQNLLQSQMQSFQESPNRSPPLSRVLSDSLIFL